MPPYKLNPPPASLPPGSQILAYLRDSGHETQEFSTQQQQNSLSEWAAGHGLVITRFYIDEARRGSTSIGRDQLQLLMNALRHGATEKAVVVWSYNRFSRGLDEPTLYRAEVRTLGYAFHSLTDDVPEGPIGRIVEAVIDYKNYQYLVDLSIDIRRGQRELVQLHGCVPGTPPRGFMRVPVTLGQRRDGAAHIAHRWGPDPEMIPLVRQAFELRAAGASLYAISSVTHLFGSLSSYTTCWSNKLYIGTLQFGDLTIENYCAAIVPLDIWNAVQAIQERYAAKSHLSSESDHPRRSASRYLLSGLLRCAQCDAPLNGNTSTTRGKRATDTYQCANVRRHLCKARRIPREQLEDLVIDTLRTAILDPDIAAERQALDAVAAQGQQKDHDDRRAALKRKLATVRAKLNRIGAAISEHGHSKTLLTQISQLEIDETNLLSQIAQSSNAPRVSQPDPLQLAALAEIATRMLKEGSLEEIRAVLRGTIQRIKVENVEKRLKAVIFYYSPA